MHRDLLHPHLAHRFDPLHKLLGSSGQRCLLEDLLIDQRRVVL